MGGSCGGLVGGGEGERSAVCEAVQWPLVREGGALGREFEGKFCIKVKVKVQTAATRAKQRY